MDLIIFGSCPFGRRGIRADTPIFQGFGHDRAGVNVCNGPQWVIYAALSLLEVKGGSLLEGKGGYDTLTGGAGSNLFVVNPNWGVDVITDFVAGTGTQDAVIFSRSIFSTYDEVISHARQVGADTWIGDGGANTVVLQNITLTSLHPDDFGFI